MVLAVGLAVSCSHDPKDDGVITVLVQKMADRPELKSISAKVIRADVIYADGSAAARQSLTEEEINCAAASYANVLPAAEDKTIELGGAVGARNFLVTLFAPPGEIAEIRFLLG